MRRFAFLAVVLSLALAVTGASGGCLSPPTAWAAANEYVIVLDGLCSTLEVGQQTPDNFDGMDGIVARLLLAGWPADSIAAYSYAGGSLGPNGRWQPLPYDCEQSRDQTLRRDVELLDAQLATMAQGHPGAAFHLVGFSLGGLVAFGELGRMATVDGWKIAGNGRVASVVSLDSPLGGVPFVDEVCALAPDICGGTPIPEPDSVLRDFGAIWASGAGTPAGGRRSGLAALSIQAGAASPVAPRGNQALAVEAAVDHGVRVLTIGNVRDWLYAPFGSTAGPYTFLDTQWLTSGASGSGVYARAVTLGASPCPAAGGDLAASYGCNHDLVMRDAAAGKAILDVIGGSTPALAATCPAGKGGCLSLPPRPAVALSSAVAAGIVKTGGTFTASAVRVPAGGRATVRFGTSPSLALAKIEIWARSKTGSYHFVTSRFADAAGVVRYFAPPVTAWTAYQARYAGDFVRGPGVSAGRVVLPR